MPKVVVNGIVDWDLASGISVRDLLAEIGVEQGEVVAARLNGNLVDLSCFIDGDSDVHLVTLDDPEGVAVMRHSCAHLLAMAVKQLYPDARLATGPVTEDGFFYDFLMEKTVSADDLAEIEQCMQRLARENLRIEREVVAVPEAIRRLRERHELLKVEIVESLPEEAAVSFYRQGDFEDLCKGPHVPSTGFTGAFRLTKVAGAYWRGDASGLALQRIYGRCWPRQEQLDAHVRRLEEAALRDHRRLGARLGYFHFQEDAPGAVFWHPLGWRLFQTLLGYMRQVHESVGYLEINTPDVMDRALWEVSGHWANYRENMFTTKTEDDRVFALKPMNCPGAVSMYKQGIRSYRDLPLRLAEFGKVHRYEPSGALHGLMRVRHFTQDDAHIFCTADQMEDECLGVISLVLDVYRHFGFDDVKVKLSTRPDHHMGEVPVWDFLESSLERALERAGLSWSVNPGEGAFYGPKLEFVLKDAIGRDWQCGTLQVDMNLPERFDATYVSESGDRLRPVMLHRALFGSLERFTGILLEHFAGALPLWLSPVQLVVMPLSASQHDYARQVFDALSVKGWRPEKDLRNEKIGYKIREHTTRRIPYMLVLGKKEAEAGTVSVRSRQGTDLGVMTLEQLQEILEKEVGH